MIAGTRNNQHGNGFARGIYKEADNRKIGNQQNGRSV